MPYALARILILMTITTSVFAEEITDISGRSVDVSIPVKKVILGEGRFVTAFGLLGISDPVPYVAATMNEFRRYDPLSYDQFAGALQGFDSMAVFGQTSADSVSIEKAIAVQPDVAIFGIQGHGPSNQSKVVIDTLEAAGIPVVFIDFRTHPLENTPRSMEILGQLLGRQEAAKAFNRTYLDELERVDTAIEGTTECPTVLLEVRVGMAEECCLTIARGLLADMIERARGCNIAADKLPGAVGTLNLEYVLAAEPDVYIGTAVGTPVGPMAGKGRIILGAGVVADQAGRSLLDALDRDGIRDLALIEANRAHGIWHHFYNSPLNIVAYQAIAKWLHPDHMHDVDPEKTLGRMLESYAPVDLTGTYMTDLP